MLEEGKRTQEKKEKDQNLNTDRELYPYLML
jgi:hypothetical protein